MKRKLLARIAAEGPMPFDEYMDACLYGPDGGFFTSGGPRSGKDADFVTSPTLSPWFGTLVSGWVMDTVTTPGVILVEVGAGSGALLKELLETAVDLEMLMYAVDVSASARAALAEEFREVEVVGSLSKLPEGVAAIVVANELLDNLPVALARRTEDGWVEIGVGSDDQNLILVEMDARTDVVSWCEEVFPHVGVDTVVSAQLAVASWIDEIFARFATVSLCLIDYAASAEDLSQRDVTSLIRTYRRHRTDIDWLAHPGESDITVDVNIDGVLKAAAKAGAHTVVKTQREFLVEAGVMELIDDARDMEHLHGSEGRVMDQLVARSGRIDLEALIDPGGLGGFTVFLIARGTVGQPSTS